MSAASFRKILELAIYTKWNTQEICQLIIKILPCLFSLLYFVVFVCVLCALPWDYCTNKMYGRYCDGDGVYLTVWMVISCVVMGWVVWNRALLGHFILVGTTTQFKHQTIGNFPWLNKVTVDTSFKDCKLQQWLCLFFMTILFV